MAMYSNRAFALDHGPKPRSPRTLGPATRRLASALRRGEPAAERPKTEQLVRRFPLVRHGYDRSAVDEYIAALERELAAADRELAESQAASAADAVASELKRIGEQTSGVLMAAHEQREEIVRRAQEEADRCVAEAKATASVLTAACEQRLEKLKGQTVAAQGERDRLLGDLSAISVALAAVVDSADERRATAGEL